MNNPKLNILLIEGNARQVLPMAKSLRKLGHEVTTYSSSKFDFGYTSRYPHHKIIGCADKDNEELTLNSLRQELRKKKYDLVIPMNDDIAILLSKHKKELEEYTSIAVNDWDIFSIASDKLETMQVCMEENIPAPRTALSIDDYQRHYDSFKFPLVVKPRTGCGAVGFRIVNSEKELNDYYQGATDKYGPCLIQEFIPQDDLQYKAEIYIDRNGNPKSAVVFAKVRWYPIDGGSSTLNKTVERPDIVESCLALLRKIGWKGYADIDLIQDPRDKTAKIIEINPRITGSVKICFKAGVNFSQQIVEDFSGQEVTPMWDYKKNVFLRYLQKDILWFIKSKNRFSSTPSWFNFRNSTDQIFDWSDPLHFFSLPLRQSRIC